MLYGFRPGSVLQLLQGSVLCLEAREPSKKPGKRFNASEQKGKQGAHTRTMFFMSLELIMARESGMTSVGRSEMQRWW